MPARDGVRPPLPAFSSFTAYSIFASTLYPSAFPAQTAPTAPGPFPSSVPLVHTDLPSELSLFQPQICLVVLHFCRNAVGSALCLLSVGTYLLAGALGLAGSNVVAVAGVVPGS